MTFKIPDFRKLLFRKKNKTEKKSEKAGIDRQERKSLVTRTELRSTHLRQLQFGSEPEHKKNPFSKIGFDPDYFTAAISRTVAGVLAITLVVYFAYQLFSMFSSSVTVSEVYTITESVDSLGKAYIIRDEEKLYLPFSGYPDFTVADGARVAKGETVLNLYSADKSEIREGIDELDKEIALLLKSIGTGVSDPGLSESFKLVEESYASLMQTLVSEDYAQASVISEAFRERLARREYLSGDAYGISNRLLELQKKKEKLQSSFGNTAATVQAPVQGYFYSGTDGYEDSLSTEILKDFSKTTLEKLETAEKNASAAAEAETAVAKLCASAEWYLALVCSDRNMSNSEIEKTYTLSFPESSGTDFEMKLVQKVFLEEGMLLLFRSDRQCPAVLGQRVQNVTVRAAEYTGYRIPESALHVCNGITGVYTLQGRYVNFRRIEIIREGTGYCIAKVYEEAETGAPKQYKIPAFSELDCIDSYRGLREFAQESGIGPQRRDWGLKSVGYLLTQIYTDRGIAVKYGQKYQYYYCLNDSENMIISGSNLYDGKVLN